MSQSSSDSQKVKASAKEPKTSEISKIVTYYLTNVRPHPREEMVGVYRNIQNLVRKGKATMSDLSKAVQNYANDPWVQSRDKRLRMHIRSFFTAENILLWKEPIRNKPVDPALQQLDQLAATKWQPKAEPPPPADDFVYDDDEVGEL